MILVDVNVLIYAHNEADERFPRASAWFEHLMSGSDIAAFCWETVNGFIRISTNRAALPASLTLSEAFGIVRGWLGQPNSVFLGPTQDHLDVVCRTSIAAKAVGRRYSDAVLAAYAISHNARFASSDKHFRMFDGLRLIDPLEDD